ncbi:MAG: tetratricopeptide repeat protein [Acidobacteria bacterium]|nr:tetratricopeptide repeat protein [Acidobacteriota bacterium]
MTLGLAGDRRPHCFFAAMPMLAILSALLFQTAAAPTAALIRQGDEALAPRRYADAETAYAKLAGLSPGVAEIHAKLGVIYFQQGKFAQAVPSLQRALKLKPSLPNADVLPAMSFSELGRFAEALPGLEKGFRR